MLTYTNPIIPGFYPDPSVCRKGDDYYLVTSSFEFFPGVPIFHSRDMINWTQIGHVLDRKSQLDLENIPASKGIYAPAIRYNPHEDLFYMVTTNTTKIGNFFVTAKDPAGDWSDPILVPQAGIDPSLFFEDDGTCHFISNARDRSVYKSGFLMGPIDTKTGEFLSEPKPVWGGIGAASPEAPHIYKVNGMYYQICAEGGTELGHMVTIARSKNLYGPYEPCPHNPILTHSFRKGHLIQATGHADLLEDKHGNWWAVFLGYRQTEQYFHHLGRETFLSPVAWVGGWPVITQPVEINMEIPGREAICQHFQPMREWDFSKPCIEWVYLRNPDTSLYEFTPKGLLLTGNGYTLNDTANPAFYGLRQDFLNGEFEVDFELLSKDGKATVSIFYKDDAHIDVVLKQGRISFCKVVGDIKHTRKAKEIKTRSIKLRIVCTPLSYSFYIIIENKESLLGTALTRNVSTEAHKLGFTGVFLALHTTGQALFKKAKATNNDRRQQQ